jgi:hypothetical protein
VNREGDERLARRGPKGDKGDKGTTKLPTRVAWALIALFALNLILAGVNLYWTGHQVNSSSAAIKTGQAQQQAAQDRLAAQQRAAALKQSRAICVALVGLDDASQGAEFAPQSRTGVPLARSYGYRQSVAIHHVVQATDCRALLAGKPPKS